MNWFSSSWEARQPHVDFSWSDVFSIISVSNLCARIQAPLGKANFIKVVSWIKDEGVYFALRSAVPTSVRGSDWTVHPCDPHQQNQRWLYSTKSEIYGNLNFVKGKLQSKVHQIFSFFLITFNSSVVPYLYNHNWTSVSPLRLMCNKMS